MSLFMCWLLSPYILKFLIIGNRYLKTCKRPGPAETSSMAGELKEDREHELHADLSSALLRFLAAADAHVIRMRSE